MSSAYLKFSMYLMSSLITTLIGGVIGSNFFGEVNYFISFIISLMLLIVFICSKGIIRRIVFYIFSFGEGICLGSIIMKTTGVDLGLCFLITITAIGVFIALGILIKDMSKFGAPLFAGIIALLIYEILKIVFPLPSIALVGIVLFCGYIAYDINSFKRRINSGEAINSDEILDYVMDVYLDVLNIFQYVVEAVIDGQ